MRDSHYRVLLSWVMWNLRKSHHPCSQEHSSVTAHHRAPQHRRIQAELRDIDADATLAALQSAVGGLIEPVHLARQRADMYVNEEGKLLSLPVNVRATFLTGALGGILGWDQIAGDAIIAGGVDEEGDTTGLDPLQVHELHAALRQV